MPNIKSAIKRVRIGEKKTKNNNSKKSEYKTAIRKFEKAVDKKSKDAVELMKKAQKSIDHACTSGVISKNAASRKVSKLSKKLAKEVDVKAEKKETKKVAKAKEVKAEAKVETKPETKAEAKTEKAPKTTKKSAKTAE